MTKKRWWILIGGIGVVAALAAGVALRDSAIAVEAVSVTRAPLMVTVDEEGRTRVRDRYVVAAPVAGRVQRIAVREGDRVAATDELARLFPTPADPRAIAVSRGQLAAAEAKRLEAAAQVKDAMAAAAQRERDLERMGNLAEAGAISQDALEQARLAATSARQQLAIRRASLRAAEAAVAAARAALIGTNPSDTEGAAVTVRAPTDGRVLRVLQQSARVVQAGTPLIEIGDARGLEAVVDVLSEDAVRIAPGNRVLIEQWGGDRTLEGQVRLLEPEAFTKVSALGVEEQRVNVIVDLLDPPAALGAGYRVEARIVTWSGDNVLQVPTSALFQEGNAWAVFVIEDGRAGRRTVTIGHQGADTVEILDGLTENDHVILYPSPMIEPGVAVQAESAASGR